VQLACQSIDRDIDLENGDLDASVEGELVERSGMRSSCAL
jgi:hypothetical protein